MYLVVTETTVYAGKIFKPGAILQECQEDGDGGYLCRLTQNVEPEPDSPTWESLQDWEKVFVSAYNVEKAETWEEAETISADYTEYENIY